METRMQRLLNEQAALRRELRAMSDTYDRENREPNAQESRRMDEILARLVVLGGEDGNGGEVGEERARRDQLRNMGSEPESPIISTNGTRRNPYRLPGRAIDPGSVADNQSIAAELFGVGAPASGGWDRPSEFWETLHSGLNDSRMIYAAQNEGTPSQGGFAVPEQLVFQMLDGAYRTSDILPRVRLEPMTSMTKKIAGFDASSAAGGTLYGGWVAEWVPEEGEMTVQTAQLRLLQLVAKKLALLAEASDELLADGIGMDDQITGAMIVALRWTLESTVLTGSGAGKPLGVLEADCTIEVAKESGQAADTIVYDNLTNMFARMHPASVANSVWYANPTAIPELATLSVPIGTGGSHVPVMRENNGQFVMLTRPVIFTEHLPALGNAGDIILADLSQYSLGLRKEMAVDKSAHVGFKRAMQTYRAMLRADGMPRWQEAYTPANGATQSPFVKLAERA